ncbi:MAG TPA: universal stress protein [Anaeromyxobacteraceae bacterium]|nr:universal stress protein [Anaeromyxobacteraceae bacterium]
MAVWSRILCPVDFSPPSRAALEEAADLAWRFAGELTLLHVDDRPGRPALGETLLAPAAVEPWTLELERQLAEWAGIAEHTAVRPVRYALAAGPPAGEILRFAAEGGFDAIVMGTHGRGGVEHLQFGSVAEVVVRGAACPVLVVRRREARDGERMGREEPAQPPGAWSPEA